MRKFLNYLVSAIDEHLERWAETQHRWRQEDPEGYWRHYDRMWRD